MFKSIINKINKKNEEKKARREARDKVIKELINDDEFMLMCYKAVTPGVIKNSFTK